MTVCMCLYACMHAGQRTLGLCAVILKKLEARRLLVKLLVAHMGMRLARLLLLLLLLLLLVLASASAGLLRGRQHWGHELAGAV